MVSMKLPVGKIVKTIPGGANSLKTLIQEFQSTSFSGNITIILAKDNDKSIGQIVFKYGKSLLAEFLEGTASIPGKKSLTHILSASREDDSTIEVHTGIDPDMMLTFFPNTKIAPKDLDVDKLITILEEEQKLAKLEADRKAAEEKRRNELKQILDKWKSLGFLVKPVEEKIDSAIPELEKIFDEFDKKISKLKKLEERLTKLPFKGFETIVESLESKLNNPSLADDVERGIVEFENTIKQQETQRNEFKKQITAWKKEGYVVSRLEEVVDGDINIAWDEFNKTMDGIQKLKENEEKLKNLSVKGFEQEIDAIISKLKNPMYVSDVEREISKLEQLIRDESEQKEQLKVKITDWKREGYITTKLEKLFIDRLQVMKQAITIFESEVGRLKELRAKFENFKIIDLKEKVEEIDEKLSNPDKIPELEKDIAELDQKLMEINARRSALRDKLNLWGSKGYIVINIKNKLDEKIESAEKAFEDFENIINKLKELQNKFESFTITGFEVLGNSIKSKLNNPNNISELVEEMADLENKIKAREKRRMELKERIEGWKQEGFVVTKLENLIDVNLDTAWNVFTTLTDEIQALKAFEKKLTSLEIKRHESEAESIKRLLKDPDAVKEVEKQLSELEETIKQEMAKKATINSQLAEWKKDGYNVSKVEGKFEEKLEIIEEAMKSLEHDIQSLKLLEEKINKLDLRGFEDIIEDLKSKLHEPSNISDLETNFKKLSEKVAEQKKIRDEIKKKMDAWKSEGYAVASLEKVVEDDIKTVQELYSTFEKNINVLKELQKKLGSFEVKWFETKRDSIVSKFKNPDAVSEIGKELVEFRNQAEALINSVENAITDVGKKLESDPKRN